MSLETSTNPDDLLKTLYAFVFESYSTKKTFYSLGSKFRVSTFLHQNVAFAPKYTKVRDIGFVTSKKFVGGFLEEAMQIEPVYGVADCVHGFRPKSLGRLELSKHRSRHVDKHHVLPLYHTVLLWCVGSRELVLDAFLLKKLFNL
jgi:hypothetical protein